MRPYAENVVNLSVSPVSLAPEYFIFSSKIGIFRIPVKDENKIGTDELFSCQGNIKNR